MIAAAGTGLRAGPLHQPPSSSTPRRSCRTRRLRPRRQDLLRRTFNPTSRSHSPTGATAAQPHRLCVRSSSPDLWGDEIRIRFSNVFGNQPLTFDAVTVGLQEYGANLVHGTNT